MTGDPDPKPQLDKFKELARELEADEDEAHFEETVRKIAPKSAAAAHTRAMEDSMKAVKASKKLLKDTDPKT